MTEAEVIRRLLAAIRTAGGESAFGRETGISQSYINNVKRGHRPPGRSVLKALGLRERADKDFYERIPPSR